jgi:hypothetical protein
LTVTVSNQLEIGSDRGINPSPAPSVGQSATSASVAANAAGRRSAIPAICGLAFALVIEAAWAGLLFFVALRLILR